MHEKRHLKRQVALFAVAATAFALSLTGCSSANAGRSASSGAGRVEVVASTDVYGDIVGAIGAERVHVTSMIHSAGQDPHSYQASTQDKLAVSKARILIENGGGYDDFFSALAAENTTGDHLLFNVTKRSEPVAQTSPTGATAAGEFNEHLWYNFETMAAFTDAISAELTRIDPSGSTTFTSNAGRFKSELHKLKARTDTLKEHHAGEPVAITEPVPLYLLQAAGLVNKTPEAYSHAIESGQDVPVSVARDTLDLISSHAVKMLAYNDQTEGPQTKTLKDAAIKASVPVVDFTETLPAGQNYLQWMNNNVDHLEKALRA